MSRDVVWLGLIAIVVIGVGVEVALRWFFGFGNPLLYVADEKIGYLLAPNQDVRRFGNRIVINEYSMRAGAIAPQRSADGLRLFLLGDSIANGGWWTDQNQTISALLQQEISNAQKGDPFTSVEVLNASANSWGPRNELAYLQAYGCFEAQILILLINTDDLFAAPPTPVQVGRDRNYPAQKPPLALVEVVTRYLLPPTPIPELEAVQAEGGDRVGKNLAAIEQIQNQVAQQGCQLVLVMTPLLRELGNPGSRDYELKARDRLLSFTKDHHISYLDILPILNTVENPATLYRDHIHLNGEGNQLVVHHMAEQVLKGAIANLTF